MSIYSFYYLLIFITISLFTLKLIFAYRYFRDIEDKIKNSIENNIEDNIKYSINEENYTVIQPILSGDPRLAEDLTANLKNTDKMKFIWLIDKNDIIAQKVVKEILKNNEISGNKKVDEKIFLGKEFNNGDFLENSSKKEIMNNKSFSKRVTVFEIDEVPQEINPKIFKIAQIIKKVQTEYIIVLDDDTVINMDRINEFSIYEKRKDEWIATGIPYNYGTTGIFSKLTAAFVNGNSFLTYFPMAYIRESKTINGMFYMGKTELFKKYNVFEEIKYELCDDLALASYLSKKGVKIIQTGVFCNVRTTVKKIMDYILLMKRWFLFTKIYIKRAFSAKFLIFIFLPAILPGLLLGISLFEGIKYIFTTFIIFIIKAFILFFFRYYLLKKKESPAVIFYEVISDIIIILIFIYTLVTPPVIKWRNKKIRVSDGRISYEKV